MNSPVCLCPSADLCRCSNSRWQSSVFYASGYVGANHPYTPGPHAIQYHPGPHSYRQEYSALPPHVSYSNQPYHLSSIDPSLQLSPVVNSVSFPVLGDTTAGVVNSEPGPQPPKRKRTAAVSGNGSRKRGRTSANTSTASTSRINTSSVVGVGPSGLSSALLSPMNTPLITIPPVPDVEPAQPPPRDPTYTAFERIVDAVASSRTATDIYFFLKPLETNEQPPPEVPAEVEGDVMVPILDSKPKSAYLGCRLCRKWRKPWKNSDGQTGTIRKHLLKDHYEIYTRTVNSLGLKHANEKDNSANTNENFTVDGWIDRLIRWIVADDQSINVVDCTEFRDFALYGRNNVSESDLPHRTSLTNLIFERYQEEHEVLLGEFKRALGRISFTSDIWSDPNLTSFMAMTAHFCTRDENNHLTISNRLLAFRVVEGSHDGENIGQVMFEIVKKAKILHQMGQWTLDNAGNNNTSLEKIERLCNAESVIFDADGNRIRCFPHIINIASQTVAKELKENPRVPVLASSIDPTKVPILHRYAQALTSDPVGKSRGLVAACRKSGQRRADLKKVIVQGNEANCWSSPLRVVQLLRDVETRWSSMFLMIGRVIELYPAIHVFLSNPKQAALISHLFGEDEFQVLHDIYSIFEIPHAAQELLSAEKTPTLSVALPAYEMLVLSWLHLQSVIPELAHYIGVGVSKIQEYVDKGRKSRIYALAMIVNPTTKLKWIEQHWSAPDTTNAREWMIEAMTAFCTSRRHTSNTQLTRPCHSTLPGSDHQTTAFSAQARGMAKLTSLSSTSRRIVSLPSLPTLNSPSPSLPNSPYVSASARPLPSSMSTNASLATLLPPITEAKKLSLECEALKLDHLVAEKELAKYLDAGLTEPSPAFNILRFWDINEMVYPLLFRVALDVLPVQASAVPCERVFSSSKETCTLRRNRLSTALLEALQILKYLFKQDRLDFTSDWLAKEEDYTIEGEPTAAAIRELLSLNKLEELADLFNSTT